MDKVLALKYRPKNFKDLVGQDRISRTISMALDSNRIAHAYLLSGLRGSGKTSTARILAKCILCENGPTSNPCEKCDSCLSANLGKHMDIVEMDAASSRGIDDIKELIEHIRYKPTSGKYKIFIIDEIHMLTVQAFNALLKTLEEPPSFVRFILATTDPLKLPATILSRTQHYRFRKISVADTTKHLSHILNLENIKYESDAVETIARCGHGSLRDSLTILDQAIVFCKKDITTTAVTDMLDLVDTELLDELFDIVLNDKAIDKIADKFTKYELSSVLDEVAEYLKECIKQADPRFDMVVYDRFFSIIGSSKYLLSINSDEEFVLLLTILKLKNATKRYAIDDIIDKLEADQPQTSKQTVQRPTKQTAKLQKTPQELYKTLVDVVFDRSFEVGQCFESSFEFVSFNDKNLLLKSTAEQMCKNLLWKNFDLIKQQAVQIYGDGVTISFEKQAQTEEIQEPQTEKTQPQPRPHTDADDSLENSDIVKEAKRYLQPTKIEKIPKDI